MSGNNDLENKNNREFNLYTENIVVKKSVKYKRAIRFGTMLITAAVFGGVACFVFTALYPLMNNMFTENNKRTEITIPKDNYTEAYTQDSEEETSQDTFTQDGSLVITEYENSYEVFRQKMVETRKCIVTVAVTYGQTEDILNKDLSEGYTSGLVIAESDNKYTILTNYSVLENVNSIKVLFNDGSSIPAYKLRGDADSGIAVIYVNLSEEADIDKSYISVAELGNSYLVGLGDIVIATGKIIGNEGSVNFGSAINVTTSQSKIDSDSSMIYTNIQHYSGDYVYLFNASGKVIGIMKNNSANNQNGVIVAYGISDLKPMIESMSNDEGITYLGVTGMNVTNSIASTYDKPIGIYITEVIENSPAFMVGIMPGDVITMIGDESVLTLKSLSEKLYSHKSGDSIRVTVKREGKDGYKNTDFSVTLGER